MPLNMELKLEVWDSPNSAGIVIDAVRCCKLALNNGLSGQLDGPSSYLMKSPMHQRPDDEARELTEKFIAKYARKPADRPRRRPRNRRRHGGPPAGSSKLDSARGQRAARDRAGDAGSPGRSRTRSTTTSRGFRDELARRGHRVLIDRTVASRARSCATAAGRSATTPQSLLERADGEPLVLGVGEVLPFSPTRRRAASLPIDVARTIEEALAALPLDVVHVHEPFAPSASSVALRHSRGAERRQLPRADRADPLHPADTARCRGCCSRASTPAPPATARPATCSSATSPATTEVIRPAADAIVRDRRSRDGAPSRRAAAVQRRARSARALRIFLRALRLLCHRRPMARHRLVAAAADRAGDAQPAAARARASSSTPSGCPRRRRSAEATCSCSPPRALRPTPGALVRALAGGIVPVASRLAAYEELLADGECGLRVRARRRADARRAPGAADRRAGAARAAASAARELRATLRLAARGRRARGRSTRGLSPAGTTAAARPQSAPRAARRGR